MSRSHGTNITDFDPNWAFADCNPSLNSPMDLKLCTLNSGQNRRFFYRVTLKFYGWPWKSVGHLLYDTSSFVRHFTTICEFKHQARRGQWWGPNLTTSVSCIELRTSIPVALYSVWSCSSDDVLVINNRAPLLSITNMIKLCALYHHHMWIQTGVTVRKRLSWVLTYVTLTFDLWPWPLSMDITSVIGNNSWKFHDDTVMAT